MNITASFSSAASVCLCASLLAAAGCSKPAAAPETKPSEPASAAGEFNADGAMAFDAKPAVDPAKALVTVDGAVLTYGEADAMVKRMLLSQGAPEAQLDAILQQMGDSMRGRIVDQFVVSTLLKNEALARKIEITDAEIEVTLSNLTARLPPGTDLKTALANMGVTLEQVRKDVSDNERIRKLYESETGKIPAATDAEVAAYYDENAEQFTTGEEVSARHILIGSREEDETKKAEAKAKAEGLRKQLVEGADFAALAAANSDCPSKAEGGSLGSFGRGRMVPAFDEAAFALATNVISEVVETPFGFHIIQVTDRKAGGKTALEDVREKVAEQLTTKKRNEAFEQVIEGLRAKATIIQDTPADEPMVEEDEGEIIEAAPGAVIESAPATAPDAPAPEASAPAAE